jgi:hypothetical protein
MKLRNLAAAFALTLTMTAIAGNAPITLTAPTGSGLKVEYDAATKVYTLTAISSTDQRLVQTNTLTKALDSDVLYLKFDYITPRAFSSYVITYCNGGVNGDRTDTRTVSDEFTVSSEWQQHAYYIKNLRTNMVRLGQYAGQYQTLEFADLAEGDVLKIRNIRWGGYEDPYKDITVGEGVTVIEAEDFNTATTTGYGHSSRQLEYPDLPTYHNPTGNQFPIYAWGGPEYKYAGIEDGYDVGALNLKKQYQEMAECGFNCTQGTAYSGVDQAALFSDRGVNGDNAVDLFEGLDMWMIAKAGLSGEPSLAQSYKESPRLAGYFIYDEPHFKDFESMRTKLLKIKQYDDQHMFYGNLLNVSTDMSAIGATSYENYVQEFVRQVGTGNISFDYYPVRSKDATGEIFLKSDYFKNLEIIAKMSKYYGLPFWSFGHSVASNCGTAGESYPTPTENHLRVQVFLSLAYGAQGIQYFSYQCPTSSSGYDYYDAPIDVDGNRTSVWYAVQAVNKDIKAMTDVFLGAHMVHVGYTHATTPDGCVRLTTDMLPAGVSAVNSDGEGVCVSLLQNGNNQYLMIVNPCIDKTQTVTVDLDNSVTHILTDGTSETVSGQQVTTLGPGGHLVYLVADNVPEEEDYTPAESYARSNYRNDVDDVIISADTNASAGYFLPDMGDRSWNVFSGILADNSNHTISEADAIDNWGSTYNYSFDTSSDIDVNIFIGHSVPWSEYGRVASTGATPGYGYIMENAPALNWPKAYAASMKLLLDDVELAPSNQPLRPAVPETFDPDGTEFNRILADKSLWVSTTPTEGAPTNVLYFWPTAGGSDNLAFTYNDEPDYQSVHLSAGSHKIVIKSLSYPWHFDTIKFDTNGASGIATITTDTDDNAPVEWFNLQGIRVNPDTAIHGVYIRRQGSRSTKVVL